MCARNGTVYPFGSSPFSKGPASHTMTGVFGKDGFPGYVWIAEAKKRPLLSKLEDLVEPPAPSAELVEEYKAAQRRFMQVVPGTFGATEALEVFTDVTRRWHRDVEAPNCIYRAQRWLIKHAARAQ